MIRFPIKHQSHQDEDDRVRLLLAPIFTVAHGHACQNLGCRGDQKNDQGKLPHGGDEGYVKPETNPVLVRGKIMRVKRFQEFAPATAAASSSSRPTCSMAETPLREE